MQFLECLDSARSKVTRSPSELIYLFVCEIERFPSCRNNRTPQIEAALRTFHGRFCYGLFNTAENELSGRTTLSGGGPMQTPVQFSRRVDAGSNGLHRCQYAVVT